MLYKFYACCTCNTCSLNNCSKLLSLSHHLSEIKYRASVTELALARRTHLLEIFALCPLRYLIVLFSDSRGRSLKILAESLHTVFKMGKDLWTEDVEDEQLEYHHPGCMWGIIHSIDYHQWGYNVKKMLPYGKHNGQRHGKGNKRSKIRLNVQDSDEAQKLLDVEASNFFVDQSTTKTSSTKKRSLGARIKALISEEMSKEEICRQIGSGGPGSSRSPLNRTYSIHHLEPSSHGPRRKHSSWRRSILFLHSKADSDTSATKLQDQGHMKGTGKPIVGNEKFNVGGTDNGLDYSEHELDENHTLLPDKVEKARASSANKKHTEADVLELFRVNKDLFIKILQNTGEGTENCFHGFQASNRQARFTKSGSFPAANLSPSKSLRPSNLKHKQDEVRKSFPKAENKFSGAPAWKIVAFKLPKDLDGKSGLVTADESVDEEQNNSSSCHEIGVSYSDLSRVTPTHIRRTSSLNQSLEKYSRLFDNSFSREANFRSKSLKVTNEYENLSGGNALMSFRRARSLTRLDSYYSVQNGMFYNGDVVDISNNIGSDGHNRSEAVDLPARNEYRVPLPANEEIECLENLLERSDGKLEKEHLASIIASTSELSTTAPSVLGEGRDEQAESEMNLYKDQEITLAETDGDKLRQPSPVSDLRSGSQEDATKRSDFPTSEGSECRGNDVNEKELSVESQYRSWSNLKASKVANSASNQWHMDLSTNNNADFDFVKEILEQSCFDENGFFGPWHSLDQPLNPLVLDELEATWPHECQHPHGKILPCCHHQVLFDLINEVLLQIYDSSFTYYPWALSFNCHIRPVPVGRHFLEEVWARISRSLTPRLEVDQSVDSVVARDLGKEDGWMNLQMDTECVALELEDLIFEELLEEVLCS